MRETARRALDREPAYFGPRRPGQVRPRHVQFGDFGFGHAWAGRLFLGRDWAARLFLVVVQAPHQHQCMTSSPPTPPPSGSISCPDFVVGTRNSLVVACTASMFDELSPE